MEKEILRYLGYREKSMEAPQPWVFQAIEEAVSSLNKTCRPRNLWKRVGIEVGRDGRVDFGFFTVKSEKLAYNLRDCREAVIMAATLGTEGDILISRTSRRDMSKAVIVEAAATALIEEYCDQVQTEIGRELEAEAKYLRPRFSPGYGDFDIVHQKDVLDLLEGQKRIGITMTDGYMLAPSKSVTAVMGITENKEKCNIKGCEACDKTDCKYRRDR